MSLPAKFRRPRIGLVGHGDVGSRILSARLRPHGPRLIPIGRRTGWNLDSPEDCRRLAALLTHWIILVPPSDQHASRDLRSLRLSVEARAARGRRYGLTHQTTFKGVYISTTGVYGNHQGVLVNETAACKTQQPRSLRRLHAERLWTSLGAHRLRVPGITGADRLPLDRIRARQPALRPEDDVFTNHIDADDLARICWVALWRGGRGRVTNTVMQGHLPMGDYFDAVADAAGLPRVPRISAEELRAAIQRGTVSPMMASFMQDSRRVWSVRLGQELRIRLATPTIEALLQRTFG